MSMVSTFNVILMLLVLFSSIQCSVNSMHNQIHQDVDQPLAPYTFFKGHPRWTKPKLTYAFLSDNHLSDKTKAVFSRAFARWAEVIPMSFTEASDYSLADIKIGFYEGEHGDSQPFDGKDGIILAHSFPPEYGIIHLDGAENWVITDHVESFWSSLWSSFWSRRTADLESVAVHEIGHLLGLGHSSNPKAIMYPSLPEGKRKVKLASDDIDGIQVLYGKNPNYDGTSLFSTSSRVSLFGSVWSLSMVVVLCFISM